MTRQSLLLAVILAAIPEWCFPQDVELKMLNDHMIQFYDDAVDVIVEMESNVDFIEDSKTVEFLWMKLATERVFSFSHDYLPMKRLVELSSPENKKIAILMLCGQLQLEANRTSSSAAVVGMVGKDTKSQFMRDAARDMKKMLKDHEQALTEIKDKLLKISEPMKSNGGLIDKESYEKIKKIEARMLPPKT